MTDVRDNPISSKHTSDTVLIIITTMYLCIYVSEPALFAYNHLLNWLKDDTTLGYHYSQFTDKETKIDGNTGSLSGAVGLNLGHFRTQLHRHTPL